MLSILQPFVEKLRHSSKLTQQNFYLHIVKKGFVFCQPFWRLWNAAGSDGYGVIRIGFAFKLTSNALHS